MTNEATRSRYSRHCTLCFPVAMGAASISGTRSSKTRFASSFLSRNVLLSNFNRLPLLRRYRFSWAGESFPRMCMRLYLITSSVPSKVFGRQHPIVKLTVYFVQPSPKPCCSWPVRRDPAESRSNNQIDVDFRAMIAIGSKYSRKLLVGGA